MDIAETTVEQQLLAVQTKQAEHVRQLTALAWGWTIVGALVLLGWFGYLIAG